MIQFKDFVPQVTDGGGFFRMPTIEEFSMALERANEWIAQDNVDVVNIETVLLPNMHNHGEEGSIDVHLGTSGEMSSIWHQFIRVWYRASSSN